MDKVTLVRTLQHTMKNHNSAGYYSLTGHAPPTDDQRLRDSRDLFPAYGSVVDKLAPAAEAACRRSSPTRTSSATARSRRASTPASSARRTTRSSSPQDPNAADFRLPELSLPADLTPERLENRREMLKLIDEQSRAAGDLRRRPGHRRVVRARPWRCSPSPSVQEGVRPVGGAGRASATATAGRPTARAVCWPGGWSRPGAKFVNVYFAAVDRRRRPAAGTRTASTTSRCTRSSRTTCCRSPTRRCRRCSRTWTQRGLLDDDAGASGWASSAARRGSTTWPAATTGRSATRRCWPAAA